MAKFDLTELNRAKARDEMKNIGAVATLVNNINRIYKIVGKDLEDYSIFYRGHADKSFLEVPSIYRVDSSGDLWVKREDQLCDEIMRECPADFNSHVRIFDKLVKMQHYELPTRLLDITENPFIALYFACLPVDKLTNNGEILIYFIPKDEIVSYQSSLSDALSCISFLSHNTFSRAKLQIKQVVEEMKTYVNHLPFLSSYTDFDKTICVRAQKNNPRIIRQQGAFFLFGSSNADKDLMSPLPYMAFRLEVLHANKKRILQELERYGISEKTLFPEIDKVAHHLKTH